MLFVCNVLLHSLQHLTNDQLGGTEGMLWNHHVELVCLTPSVVTECLMYSVCSMKTTVVCVVDIT